MATEHGPMSRRLPAQRAGLSGDPDRTGSPEVTVGSSHLSGAYPDRSSRTASAPRAQPLCTFHDPTGNLEPGEPCPRGPAGSPDDRRAYEEKLDTIAVTITELHPDVLAVQEVLDPNALDDL